MLSNSKVYEGLQSGAIIYDWSTGKSYQVLNNDTGTVFGTGPLQTSPIQLTEIRHPQFHGSATVPPTTFGDGDEYWNTTDVKFYKYNGSSWIALN